MAEIEWRVQPCQLKCGRILGDSHQYLDGIPVCMECYERAIWKIQAEIESLSLPQDISDGRPSR